MYLGLDLSLTSTGLCALVDSTLADTTVCQPDGLQGSERIRYICNYIESFLTKFGGVENFELAAIENYAFAGVGKSFHLAELGGVVRDRLYHWGMPYIVVNIQHNKLFATGHGNADKAQVGQALAAAWGQNFAARSWPGMKKGVARPADWGQQDKHWRTDEADAYVLANVAALYDGVWDRQPTAEQLQVIESIKLDPQGILSVSAKARNAAKQAARKSK